MPTLHKYLAQTAGAHKNGAKRTNLTSQELRATLPQLFRKQQTCAYANMAFEEQQAHLCALVARVCARAPSEDAVWSFTDLACLSMWLFGHTHIGVVS
jgi:hypothetical protein